MIFTLAIFSILTVVASTTSDVSSTATANSTTYITVGGIKYKLKEDKCSNDCLKLIRNKAKSYMPNSTHFDSLEELKIFCPNVYTPNKGCFDKCSRNNSDIGSRLLYEYECGEGYEGFVNDRPCVQNVMTQHGDMCSCYTNNHTIKLHNETDYMLDNFRTIKCELNCLYPFLRELCGESGVKFFKELNIYSLRLADKEAMIVAGKPHDWPEEVRAFLKELET